MRLAVGLQPQPQSLAPLATGERWLPDLLSNMSGVQSGHLETPVHRDGRRPCLFRFAERSPSSVRLHGCATATVELTDAERREQKLTQFPVERILPRSYLPMPRILAYQCQSRVLLACRQL